MLTFLVDTKQAFEVSLADVSQTQLQGKNDVILEFHVDDTTGANEVCCLYLWVFIFIKIVGFYTVILWIPRIKYKTCLAKGLGF